MDSTAPPIAVVQGADGAIIQALFARFAKRWSERVRIVGLIEDTATQHLRSITDGGRYRLFQDLGGGSDSCALDAESLVRAGEAARRDIMAGCDIAILSKFGKLEAENRSGLMPAFAAAVERGTPILTSVAPRLAPAWALFADPLSIRLSPTLEAVEAWWTAISPAAGQSTKPAVHNPPRPDGRTDDS